jgi:hypothetical protein
LPANHENKRRGYRVDDAISMLDTPLSAEAFEQKKRGAGIYSHHSGLTPHITSGETSTGAGFDHLSGDLAKMLHAIDQKLNYLISAQMLSDANRLNLTERPVNLSISGMRFLTESHYKEGDGMKITMMLPGSPPLLMELLAKVTRAEPAKEGQQVAVDFVFRGEEEEDNLSQYILKREREMIRRTAQKEEKRH